MKKKLLRNSQFRKYPHTIIVKFVIQGIRPEKLVRKARNPWNMIWKQLIYIQEQVNEPIKCSTGAPYKNFVRIVGGILADISEIPYQVGLQTVMEIVIC